jgi:hypothetical protein
MGENHRLHEFFLEKECFPMIFFLRFGNITTFLFNFAADKASHCVAKLGQTILMES